LKGKERPTGQVAIVKGQDGERLEGVGVGPGEEQRNDPGSYNNRIADAPPLSPIGSLGKIVGFQRRVPPKGKKKRKTSKRMSEWKSQGKGDGKQHHEQKNVERICVES